MHGSPQDRGFALVLAIWAIALISLLIAGYAALMRSEIKLASNAIEAQRAEALADAGAELALLDIGRAASIEGYQRKYPSSGAALVCRISDDGLIRLTVSDEAGRVDLNAAGVPLLEALFAGLGEGERASSLAATLHDFLDADDIPRPGGAENSAYAAAGLSWGPKNSPLAGIEELSQVIGFDAELLIRLEPHITVHTGQAGIAAEAISPALFEVLRIGSGGRIISLSSFPELDRDHSLPRIFLSPSRRKVFAIRSEARSGSGGEFVREVVIRVSNGAQPPFEVLRWRKGRSLRAPPTIDREALCPA